MFEKTKEALYRFHILSSTYSKSIASHGENCNLQTAAYGELDNALKLVEGQKPSANSDYASALREISDIINSTNYSVSKYVDIVNVIKRLHLNTNVA